MPSTGLPGAVEAVFDAVDPALAFRHTCASLLFDQGRNVKQVAEWLGHADPAFTLRTYVHLMDAGVGAADFLDEAVAAPSRNKDRIAVDPA
jgi:integrase